MNNMENSPRKKCQRLKKARNILAQGIKLHCHNLNGVRYVRSTSKKWCFFTEKNGVVTYNSSNGITILWIMSCHISHATINMLKWIKKSPVRVQGRLIFQIGSENVKKKIQKGAIDATTFYSVQVNRSQNAPIYLLLIANSSLRIFVYSSGESWGGRPPTNKFTRTMDLLFSTM